MGNGGNWELRSEALRGRAASERRILAWGSAYQLEKRLWRGMVTPPFERQGVSRDAFFSFPCFDPALVKNFLKPIVSAL